MTEQKLIPTWFWIIAVLALIWNLLGVMAFFGQVMMTPETLAALPEDQRSIYESMPSWVNIAFALAVFGGTLGCIALLLKKSWAIPLFIISLVGIIAQMYHSFFISNSYEVFGPGGLIMPVMVILIGIFLVWFSKKSTVNGWVS